MSKRKVFEGQVISDKMQKTVVVKTTRISKHPKYSRIMKSSNKFKAHDENGIAKMGDTVCIEETRPLSKDKRFRVVSVIKKAEAAHLALKEEETK
jgi:small subunit ribosomal protein S17